MRVSELDTPALLIDLDIMDRNLARVAGYAAEHSLRLRPHTKTHKIPALGRLQMELGAVGLTVAKTSEAEVMVKAEPGDLLIAYPVIGRQKLERLARVAKSTRVTVALDNLPALEQLAEAARELNFEAGVYAEFDAGLHRVGVAPSGEDLLDLVRAILQKPKLEFRGVAFYPGHIKDVRVSPEEQMAALDRVVSQAVELLEARGIAVPIVSGGSTPTLYQSHKVSRLTEIRPGTYIFNDRNTWLTGGCGLADCAASILTTVVSTAVPGQMIMDGGSKTFSSDRSALNEAPGFGYLPEAQSAVFTKMNEEHGFVDITSAERMWKPGERVRVIPNHVCVAMNLHEQVYGIRGDEVVKTWRVEGRGRLQ